MGEEVQMTDIEGVDDNEERVLEWEDGLPNAGDLTPLSQHLIPPELASAFNITIEPCRSMIDVNRASQDTLSSIRRHNLPFPLPPFCSSNNLKLFPSFNEDQHLVVEGDDHEPGTPTKDGSESRKIRRIEITDEDADLSLRMENSCNDDQSARTLKRPRLVWTPQLHKRFVDVVAHLGIKNAVPKTIMQLMNVEGLTRENVASHLQKYRIYLKRMQGMFNEGPSSTEDHLFASTPVPKSLRESTGGGHILPPLPPPPPPPQPSMPYGGAPFFPMPVLGMGHGHMGMAVGNLGSAAYPGAFDFHPYNMLMREQQRDWSNNKFSPMMSYPHATNGDK